MNEVTIEQLMGLVESSGYFYTRDTPSTLEIRYAQKADNFGEKGWGHRIVNIGQYAIFTADKAISIFNTKQVDIAAFHSELMVTIGVSAFDYHRRTQAIKEVIGDEAYQKVLEVWDKFGRDIANLVHKTITRSKMHLIKGH